eukprot:249121-Chlamydomonas_euryale.AAC.19
MLGQSGFRCEMNAHGGAAHRMGRARGRGGGGSTVAIWACPARNHCARRGGADQPGQRGSRNEGEEGEKGGGKRRGIRSNRQSNAESGRKGKRIRSNRKSNAESGGKGKGKGDQLEPTIKRRIREQGEAGSDQMENQMRNQGGRGRGGSGRIQNQTRNQRNESHSAGMDMKPMPGRGVGWYYGNIRGGGRQAPGGRQQERWGRPWG